VISKATWDKKQANKTLQRKNCERGLLSDFTTLKLNPGTGHRLEWKDMSKIHPNIH
jgi:hypothetical protein